MGKHYEIDSEKLIEAIKKKEQIWNKNSEIYQKKHLKETAWVGVCEEICGGWDDMDEHEKTIHITKAKKRWNNIRDYYKKDLALQLNGSIGQGLHAMKQKKYIFSNKLEFLRPIFDKTIANQSNEYMSDNEQEEYMVVNYTSDSEDATPLKTMKTEPKTTVQTGLHVDSSDDESDLMFLKSLAPDMKVLTRSQKIDFKLGILQLYKNITTPQHRRGGDPLDDEEDKKFAV